jgi:hypothetical protein
MSNLKGAPQLKARLKAIRETFKPLGREWADEVVIVARPMVPVVTGRLRGSIRRKSATGRKATVVAHYSASFIDAGTKAHTIVPKRSGGLYFTDGGRTVFAKKVNHPRTQARPFRQRAAEEGLRRHPLDEALVKQWNGAA